MVDENKSCVQCEQGMISDANSINNCELCGMVIIFDKNKFCCEDCSSKIEMINNG